VRAAAADVVRRGFLLPQDVDALVSEAGGSTIASWRGTR